LAIGIAIACSAMAVFGRLLLGGWTGSGVGIAVGLAAAILHAAFYLVAGGVINGFGHASAAPSRQGGYAANMPAIAWLTVGEGWHHNHHIAENSPRLGLGRQFDPGWLAIRALQQLRLARTTTRGASGIARLRTLRDST
jgi:fatty-acid desaturase